MPAFMRYDSTLRSRFEIKPHDFETITNQNYLLTKYPGGIGGKIGWTVSSEATYVGLARRNGVTLIATVLHCTALQEITSAERLLTWGFAMNGKVSPVGVLVPPVATTAARHPPAASTKRHAHAAHRPQTVALAASRPGADGQHDQLRPRSRRHHRRWPRPYRSSQDAAPTSITPSRVTYGRRGRASAARPTQKLSHDRAANTALSHGRPSGRCLRRCLPLRFPARGGVRRRAALLGAKHRHQRRRAKGGGAPGCLCRRGAAAGTGSLVVALPRASARSAGSPRAAVDSSPAAMTVNRPRASAATNTITTPRPVKNPSCSIAALVAPPTGDAGAGDAWPGRADQVADGEPRAGQRRQPCRQDGRRSESADEHHDAADQRHDTGKDFKPHPACGSVPGPVGRICEVEIRAHERDQRAPDAKQN